MEASFLSSLIFGEPPFTLSVLSLLYTECRLRAGLLVGPRCSRRVVSNSCDPVDCSSPRPLRPWDSPGKNTGVGCHFLLRGIFLTHGSNPSLQLGRPTLYHCAAWEAPSRLSSWSDLSLLEPIQHNHCSFMVVAVWLLRHVCICDPTDCSPPGSSVHGILQARILEWVAISSSRRSS